MRLFHSLDQLSLPSSRLFAEPVWPNSTAWPSWRLRWRKNTREIPFQTLSLHLNRRPLRCSLLYIEPILSRWRYRMCSLRLGNCLHSSFIEDSSFSWALL